MYIPAFPVAEERESRSDWEQLLWGADPGPPQPALHVLVAHDGLDAVQGLVVGEYYRESNCGLISYIAVSAHTRQHGLGERLMRAIIDVLDADARGAHHERLAAVFAEVHDPPRAPAGDSMDPAARMRFMARCGGRVVPVPYVQPQLASGGGRVRNLLLLVFPVGGHLPDLLPSRTVIAFLDELYRALGVAHPADDADFRRMEDELRGATTELLRLKFADEVDTLLFSDYAIVVHLVLENESEMRLPPRSANLDSFEQDMLAYAFRGAPPLRTVLVATPDEVAEVDLVIPPVMSYRAEGWQVVLGGRSPGPRRRRLRVKCARTDFLRSGLSVLHLIFTPGRDRDSASLNEYDIVKLIKVWEGGEGLPGPGEKQDWLGFQPVGPQPATEPAVAFIDLAQRWLDDRGLKYVSGSDASTTYRVGTIQLLTATSASDGDESLTDELMADIMRLREDPGAFSEARRDDAAWRRLKALGGIIQGLLDFEEIDELELSDVFSECEGDVSSQLVFHKGTLLHIAPSDRVWESTRDYLGVNPYLMIAHGLVLHNEVLLKEAAALVEEVLESHPAGRAEVPVSALTAKRADISRTLDAIVPNVMHYDQERSIYERGHVARRLTDLDAQVRGGLDRSGIVVQSRLSERATLAGALVGVLVALITAATFLPKWSIPVLILVAGCAYYAYWRMSPRQSA